MTDIYIDYPRLENAAAQLRAHKKTFDEILAQLESDLAPMIATWSGEARDLYLAKKTAWDRAAADLTALLAHIAALTEQAHGRYAGTVGALAQMWA